MQYFSTRKKYATRKPHHPVLRFLTALVRLFMPKHAVIWECPEPSEPAVFCCNHGRAYGPMAMFSQFPRRKRAWVIYSMCFYKDAVRHMKAEFWTAKSAFGRFFVNILCHILAPISVGIMSGIEGIPVYYDIRVSQTFRKTIETLDEGLDILIFPENSQPYYAFDHHFSDGFVQIGYRYYRKTGKVLSFYPMFACKPGHTITVGAPLAYDPSLSYDENRRRIGAYICSEMIRIGKREMSAFETLEQGMLREPIDHD